MARSAVEIPEDSLGLRVRMARIRRRWKQRELAQRLGMSESALSRIENDLARPSVDGLVKLAEELGTTPDTLLGYSEDSATASKLSGKSVLAGAAA